MSTYDVPGVCVFDLDGTLYKYKCGRHDSADECRAHIANVIAQCKECGLELAINTARFRISSRLKRYLLSLGLNVDSLPRGAVQLRAFTPHKKARAMKRIAAVYNAHPNTVLLYDNMRKNVHRVVNQGYRGVDVTRTGFVHPMSAINL